MKKLFFIFVVLALVNNSKAQFYLHLLPGSTAPLVVKVFLQGAYNTPLLRHKNITTAWVTAMNTGATGNALSQPYSGAPFNYAGTESVASFPSSTNSGTDILDWVLLELWDANTPSIVKSTRAAFVLCDGRIVDLDGVSPVSFSGASLIAGNYFLAIRHRNHLGIRSANTVWLSASPGTGTPDLYDFSTAQSQAYQDATITPNNGAMKDLGSGVFGMWAGNGAIGTAAAYTSVRPSGPPGINDYLFLINTTLGGNISTIIPNVYSTADLNMDGTVRASGTLNINDYSFLRTTVLDGDVSKIINQHVGIVITNEVTICSQVWMTKNLDVSTYRDGTPIPKITDNAAWFALTTGAYCYFNNDSATYAATYGKLYNWYAVNDSRGLAPAGWHIPTNGELTALETCLGGLSVAGGKMKETGTAHWASPNTGATNSSGFTALGGGTRSSNAFRNLNIDGYFWTSTDAGSTAWGRYLHYAFNNITTFNTGTKRDGFSVRCIKD